MLLVLIRAVFVLVVAGFGVADGARSSASIKLANPYVRLHRRSCCAAIAVVVVDILTPRKRIQTISAIYIGLIVGIFLIRPAAATPSSRPCSSISIPEFT